MIPKCILFLAAGLLLANCSALGSAHGPVAATGSPVAWDGLGIASLVVESGFLACALGRVRR